MDRLLFELKSDNRQDEVSDAGKDRVVTEKVKKAGKKENPEEQAAKQAPFFYYLDYHVSIETDKSDCPSHAGIK